MSVQVLQIDSDGLQESEFIFNFTKSSLQHLAAGFDLIFDVVNEVGCSVNGGGDLGVPTLDLGADGAESFLGFCSSLSNVGCNGLQGVVTVMEGVS